MDNTKIHTIIKKDGGPRIGLSAKARQGSF